MHMRKPADWMATGPDDRILEYLAGTDRAIPTTIASAAGYTNKHVAQRCDLLAENGLLEDQGSGFYSLTDEGRRYLDGELDVADLEGDDAGD
jgi:predicted transcriptional regulator